MKKSQCPEATVEELTTANWQVPVSINSIKDYRDLSKELGELSVQLKAEGKMNLADSASLLALICSISLKSNDRKEPFAVDSDLGNGFRTFGLEDLIENDLKILAELLNRTTSSALKARIADILWLKAKPRKIEYAKLAIENYILLAKQFREPKPDFSKLLYASYALQRAAYLQQMISGEEAVRQQILKEISDCMFLDKPEPPTALRHHFYKLLHILNNDEEIEESLKLGEKIIAEALSVHSYDKARKYLDCMIQLQLIKKDKNKVELLKERKTDLHVEEARISVGKVDPMILQRLFNIAIAACRQTPSRKDVARELSNELIHIQKEVINSLSPIPFGFDIGEIVKPMIDFFDENDFRDCLLYLANSTELSKDKYLKQAEEIMSEFPLQSLIATTLIDHKGKPIAVRPGVGKTQEENQAATRARASQNFQFNVEAAGALINIAQKELIHKLDLDEDLLAELLDPNPFIQALIFPC